MTDEPTRNSWSNPEILRAIPNPDPNLEYVVEIRNPEVTFLGVKEQPDFCVVLIEYIPGSLVIELKSLKKYFFDFRTRVLSYERLVSVLFTDLGGKYQPKWMRITVDFNPRGGIASKLIANTDDNARGK